MSDQQASSSSDSDTEYVPGMVCSDNSDDSCDDDCEYESDDDTADVVEPVVDQGWMFMSDPFSDSRPDPLPQFGGDNVDAANPAILSITTVPSFTGRVSSNPRFRPFKWVCTLYLYVY